jgi:hypothetical protein
MQTHAWMRRQKGADLLRLMSGEVVDDEVNRALARLRLDDRLQERDELVPGVTRHGAAQHFARARVEGRIQRARAVAVILEPVSFGPARRQREQEVDPIERLNRGLLVDTETGPRVAGARGRDRSRPRPSSQSPGPSSACSARGDAVADRRLATRGQ